eukprot:31424-Pelagococcus_subviridis.AAC.7
MLAHLLGALISNPPMKIAFKLFSRFERSPHPPNPTRSLAGELARSFPFDAFRRRTRARTPGRRRAHHRCEIARGPRAEVPRRAREPRRRARSSARARRFEFVAILPVPP